MVTDRHCYPVYFYCYSPVIIPQPIPKPDFFLFAPNDVPITLHCGQTSTTGTCIPSNSPPITLVVESFNGYTGSVTLSTGPLSGLVVNILPPNPQLIPPGGSVPYTETISTTTTTALGNYAVVNVATDGTLTHAYVIIVHVVP